ncbi:MAG: hypothetical protein PHX04_03610 [Bacilli bacterium]|nr:hypothetical protein [Bacilli bacterium]
MGDKIKDDKIFEKLISIEEKSKNNNCRINNLEKETKNISQSVVAIKEIAIEIKYMRIDIVDIIARLKELENIPKNRWNDLIKVIITVVITTLTTFIFIKLGLK